MDFTGYEKLILFAENAQIIKKEFVWHNTSTKRLAALLYALEGKAVDCDAIKQCHDLIKENTGMFSTFRGNLALCLAALLSLTPNPKDVLGESLKVYELLKGVKLHASDYLVVAAYQIATLSKGSEYEETVNRTRSFYDEMRSHHFFYTGQDDYIFSAMLGLSDLDTVAGAERIEQIYNLLKGEFWDKNSVQALAQVLVLGNSDEAVVKRVLDLRNALREQKIKLDKSYTLPLMGIFSLLPVEINTIAKDIGAAHDMLRGKKGFGGMSVSAQESLLLAASIVAVEYAESVECGILTATLSTSITNIIIAQQTAIIAAIIASTTATSVSSSS